MKKNKRLRKEEIAEDWCFVCKEGGLLILCDHKDCLKSYHPHCVGKDGSVVDSRENWKCDWHICCICKKAAKFHCFCCPTAICGRCIEDVEFVVVRGIKGFCINCLRLALLWEEKKDVNLDGVKIDFTRKTVEGLFIEYWEIIKEKEGLEREHLQRAQSLLMKGRNYKHFEDANDFSTNDLNSLDLADCEDWELEMIEDYNPSKRERRRLESFKNRTLSMVESKKVMKRNTHEFVSWGSRALIDFLASINEDTSVELTQYDVTNIVTRYVDRKNLFDQQKKKMIVCDQSLQALLGKKMVNKNRLYSLLEAHFASNIEESEEDHESSSQENDDDKATTPCKRKKIRNSNVTSNFGKIMSRSTMAAVIPENLRLVYLKKTLVEELLKDSEGFEAKVVGSFVRVKSDPHDYMQKNSHQLVQVTAVKKRLIDGVDTTVLQVSNMPIDVDLQMLSDSDFTKEEFEQLCRQMKGGLHKKLTVVELECKAGILHEDITKHWITKELALLKNLIDKANEKGWKRELGDYKERRRLLLEPSEQSRLMQEIPQVIAEEVEIDANSGHDKGTRKAGTDPCIDLMDEGDSVDNGDINVVTTSGYDDNVEKTAIGETMAGKNDTTAVKLEDHDMTIPPDDQNALPDEISLPVTPQHKQEVIEIIDLDDDDDDDNEIGEKMKIGTACPTEIEPTKWYCIGPLGDVRGPYEMSFLRTWNQMSGKQALKFKVWKIGQRSADAIPLPEACDLVVYQKR